MTSVALVLAPLACAVVLLVSGVAKMGDPTAARDAFASMGVPQALRSPLVEALPYAELTLGVLLLATWSWLLAVVGAVATALFAAYWVLVLRVLRRGEPVDCGCFGALADDRVSGTTLARNSVLVVLGALATSFGAAGSGVLPAVRDFRSTDWWWLVLSVAVAATAVLVVGLRRPDEAVGEDLLDYERVLTPFALLEDETGDRTTLRQLAATRPQLLFFLSSSCWACETVAEQIPAWTTRLGPVEISTVFTESLADLPPAVRPGGVPAWFDVERGATETFAATGRPAAVLLGADGALAGGPVAGPVDVAAFVEEIVAELAAGPAAPMLLEPGQVDDPGNDDPGNDDPGHDHERDHGHRHEHA